MKKITCIVCPNSCELSVDKTNGEWIITGNLCPRGREFAVNEITNPKRSLCSTVKTIYADMPRLPVRTDGDIPLKDIFPLMKLLSAVVINQPIHSGEIIIENALNTGINVIATSDMYYLQEAKQLRIVSGTQGIQEGK